MVMVVEYRRTTTTNSGPGPGFKSLRKVVFLGCLKNRWNPIQIRRRDGTPALPGPRPIILLANRRKASASTTPRPDPALASSMSDDEEGGIPQVDGAWACTTPPTPKHVTPPPTALPLEACTTTPPPPSTRPRWWRPLLRPRPWRPTPPCPHRCPPASPAEAFCGPEPIEVPPEPDPAA